MKSMLRVFGFFGSIVFGCFLPQILWSMTWMDLSQIIYYSSHGDGQKIEWLSQLTKELGINQNSIKEWAIQRILISIGIVIGIFIIILILTAFIKKEKQNT